MRHCERCQGKGQFQYDNEFQTCRYCEGRGTFPEFNEVEILSLILATKGKNKGKLRASMTSPYRSDGLLKNRAYYVWRMVRFHAGVDVTMPVMAGLCISYDPYRKNLDALSDKVAADSIGNNVTGAMVWGKALGYL